MGSCPEQVSIIVSSDQKITCHKALLAFYSEFFDASFYGGFVEAERGEVELQDVNFEHLKAYVGWIYTGTIESEVSAEELWVLGDRLLSPEFTVCSKYPLS